MKMNEKKYEKEIQKYIKLSLASNSPAVLCRLKIDHIRDGKVISREERHARSWVRNKFNLDSAFIGLSGDDALAFQDGQLNIKDTGGTIRTDGFLTPDVTATPISLYSGAAGDSTHGIVVGTGVAAESVNDFILSAIVNHGVGAGQLSYGACGLFSGPTYTPATKTWDAVYTRNFANVGGGAITLTESGIYSTLYVGATRIGLTCRDLWTVPVASIIGDSILVEYQPYIVFPA